MSKSKRVLFGGVAAMCGVAGAAMAGDGFVTGEKAMMDGLDGWTVTPVLTIGEEVGGYTAPGILDGLGAYKKDSRTVRVLANHELASSRGAPYRLANGTYLTGGRVSYFDLDRTSRTIVDAGPAYDTIYDRAGKVVTDDQQINENGAAINGLNRLCSSQLVLGDEGGGNGDDDDDDDDRDSNHGRRGGFGFVDTIYFTGEETTNGTEWALDVERGDLWACPDLGRAAWENVTPVETGRKDMVALLIGDDTAPAPLYLYVGEKNSKKDSFLRRNGLQGGKLFVWVSDKGDVDPSTFRGTGATRTGTFREIDIFDASKAGTSGYDARGYMTQSQQYAAAKSLGAFFFSRPEDVATNPAKGTQCVLASTGRDSLFGGADKWGTIYVIDHDFSNLSKIRGSLRVAYDGNDAGNQDYGIRSPDNLDWATDGYLYVQEDAAFGGFGQTSGEEASIWRLDPVSSKAVRVARMNRSAVVPAAIALDRDAGEIGSWESSGVIDVTSLFPTRKGEMLLIADVEAHGINNVNTYDADANGSPDKPWSPIRTNGLEEGGQLFFLGKGGK